MTSTDQQTVLYGAPLSLFSGKARAYLRWRGVPFEERLSTPEVYKTIIIPRIGYPMIPVIETPDGQTIQDTTEIIDHFEKHTDGPSVFPDTPKQRFAAHLLEFYGDEWLLIPAMHYRWRHNRDFAHAEFGKTALPDGDEAAQIEAGRKASKMFEGVVPMLGATPEMTDAIEASYEALLGELDAHFARHSYLFGTRPSIGDYGLIGPLYAHLYRDPASGEIMKRLAPNVVAWVRRMHELEGAEPESGEFLDGDEIPETLLPVLRRMMREQGPCIQDMTDKVGALKQSSPDADIPRALGMQPFTLEDRSGEEKTGQRLVFPYGQWLLQRATDHQAGLSDEDRKGVDGLLGQIGGDFIKPEMIKAPVKRENHKLVWA
ncbi:glutathione S-transferase family protein [Parvularcula maris]|uniref:Glutathione S-transferase family protein n=1 Tax=Parvularcula maris TaxID=2965077 RepID=A0A9X2L700_9PROT|nr:glutathione S-transferase family protein [Parvularcula maris]MCQ8184223.1 glutathione S-transferase family protein [Parvularcula maris]